MERTEVLDVMGDLKLYWRSAYDDTAEGETRDAHSGVGAYALIEDPRPPCWCAKCWRSR